MSEESVSYSRGMTLLFKELNILKANKKGFMKTELNYTVRIILITNVPFYI